MAAGTAASMNERPRVRDLFAIASATFCYRKVDDTWMVTREHSLCALVFLFLEVMAMCRNIKTLFNFDPPVTSEEIRAASLQFVRKISGFSKPSKANEGALQAAVDEIAGISTRLLRALETNAPPKNREEEAAKAKARAAERFGA
jgi:hypothetical protein